MKKKKIFISMLAACGLSLCMTAGVSAKAENTSGRYTFWSEEEVSSRFGELPHYLDLGSFVINRMNHLPLPFYKDSYMIVEGAPGFYYKTRPSFSYLQKEIETILANCQGDWGVYIKDLSNGNVISINEHPMQAASEIKLFIAGATLEQIENGTIKETDTIKNALYQMITVSDNESSNVLVRSFYNESEGQTFKDGLAVVNDFIKRYGFTNTQQVNGIADPSLWVSDGKKNETSPADCGKILEYIYNRELVSHYASYRMENLLNKQEVNYKIPRGLPEGTPLAHKTGEVDDTENDAAIIYTPYGDYIFCIMSTDLYSTGSAVDTIHQVTALVYDWFTHPLEVLEGATLEEALSDSDPAQDSES